MHAGLKSSSNENCDPVNTNILPSVSWKGQKGGKIQLMIEALNDLQAVSWKFMKFIIFLDK